MSYTLFGDDPPQARSFASRNTSTPGQRFEAQVGTALIGYTFEAQCVIGKSFGGRRGHRVDYVVSVDDGIVLVSAKWQGTKGTGEEKVPHEVDKLAEAIHLRRARRAYIVLGGNGWTLREYFESTDFHRQNRGPGSEYVSILGLEKFIELCNRQAL